MGRVAKDPRDGKWLARWRDPSGKQGKKSFRRKIDAERFLNEMMSQINRGMYVDPAAGKIAFGVYAATWASGLAHLKETTASRYRDVLRTHVLPKWGDWRLAKIAHSDVAIWVSDLRKHLSAGSVRKVYWCWRWSWNRRSKMVGWGVTRLKVSGFLAKFGGNLGFFRGRS